MTVCARILKSLPATVCELAAIEGVDVRTMNSRLCYLRGRGKVKRTNLQGTRYGLRGPKPALWEKT